MVAVDLEAYSQVLGVAHHQKRSESVRVLALIRLTTALHLEGALMFSAQRKGRETNQASPPSGRSIDRSSNGAKRATVTAQTGPEQLDFFNHSHAEISPQSATGIAGLAVPMMVEHRPIIIDSAWAAARLSESRVNRMRA